MGCVFARVLFVVTLIMGVVVLGICAGRHLGGYGSSLDDRRNRRSGQGFRRVRLARIAVIAMRSLLGVYMLMIMRVVVIMRL